MARHNPWHPAWTASSNKKGISNQQQTVVQDRRICCEAGFVGNLPDEGKDTAGNR